MGVVIMYTAVLACLQYTFNPFSYLVYNLCTLMHGYDLLCFYIILYMNCMMKSVIEIYASSAAVWTVVWRTKTNNIIVVITTESQSPNIRKITY